MKLHLAPSFPLAVMLTAGLLGTVMLSTAVSAQSREDTLAACRDAASLLEADDIDGALEEANWCLEGLKQMQQALTLTLLPDELDGFVGGEISNQTAMGMTMIERRYSRDGDAIDVSLTAGDGAAGGGLAALAQMGLAMGAGAGSKMRIQKRTVIDTGAESGEANFLVQLKSGGMLTISSATVGRDDVLAFVRAFPIAELDDSLSR